MIDVVFFFFNDTATTEIYTLSLHDALPIYELLGALEGIAFVLHYRIIRPFEKGIAILHEARGASVEGHHVATVVFTEGDRKSTRLNSSHDQISYAVFCLKKKIPHMRTLTSA